jgi:mannose-6-phosphate isomerase-like protein (cupin superfamily)
MLPTPFMSNIAALTIENVAYRRVVYTDNHLQLVVMSLAPLETIDTEIHPNTSQFIRIERGNARAILDDRPYDLFDDSAIIIPAGVKHKIVNLSASDPFQLLKTDPE